MDFKDLLAHSHAALGNYALAYEHQSDYLLLHDSMTSLQRFRQINELEAQYQLSQKEAENQLISEKQIRQQATLQKRNAQIVAVIALLFMVSWFAINYYRSSQQKQLYNTELRRAVEERTTQLNRSIQDLKDTNQELENFAFIASHDLKEPLRSIISFNNLIQKKLKDQVKGEIKDYFNFVNNSGSADVLSDRIDAGVFAPEQNAGSLPAH